MKSCCSGVSATGRGKAKQVLDGVVSKIKMMGKWELEFWEEMKNVEQWCFSIGKTDERLLVHGVSATGGRRNKCWTELFR
jgi:hypothetical protein